jgi:hypothetical protein
VGINAKSNSSHEVVLNKEVENSPKILSVISFIDENDSFESFTSSIQDVSYSSSDSMKKGNVVSFPSQKTELGNIVGIVYDYTKGELLSNVIVSLKELQKNVTTDKDGRFSFVNVPTGYYTFEIIREGYKRATYEDMPVSSTFGTELYSFYVSPTEEVYNKFIQPENDLDIYTEESSIEDLLIENEQQKPHDIQPMVTTYFNAELRTPITVLYNGTIYAIEYNEYVSHVIANELYKPEPGYTYYGSMTNSQIQEFFKAQAVAVRGYTNYYEMTRAVHTDYTICSTTHCQVYNPYYTNAMSVEAVNSTNNIIPVGAELLGWFYVYDYFPCRYFSACLGNTLSGGHSYLAPVSCLCSGEPAPEHIPHCIGMCQRGAKLLAASGYTYDQILNHYYTGITLVEAIEIGLRSIKVGETITRYNNEEAFCFYAPVTGVYHFRVQALYEYCPLEIKIYDSSNALIGSKSKAFGINGDTLVYSINLNSGLYKFYGFSDLTYLTKYSVERPTSSPLAMVWNNDDLSCNYIHDVSGKYYKLIPKVSKVYTISTEDLPGYDSYSPVLYLLDSSGFTVAEDDFQINNFLVANVTYYIYVRSYEGYNMYCRVKII